jgi:uncharacterized protein YkwD
VTLLPAALAALLVVCPWSGDDDRGRDDAPVAPAVASVQGARAPGIAEVAPVNVEVRADAADNGADTGADTAADAEAARVVALTNAARADAGCGLVAETAALRSYAADWAATMAGGLGMVHSNLGAGVLAENIAWGQDTADEVVAAWLASPGHRRNILDCSYTAIGAAHVGDYWSQNFA